MNYNIELLDGYPKDVIETVEILIHQNKLDDFLNKRYNTNHTIKNNKVLFEYVQHIKKRYMKKSQPIHRVFFDDKIDQVYKALGLNSSISSLHGRKTKAIKEIRISSLFKDAPIEFLEMVVVHELAHLKVKNHNKEFYSLCHNIIPDYFQREFDFRLYLISTSNTRLTIQTNC